MIRWFPLLVGAAVWTVPVAALDLCARHYIQQERCPFCHPELIEEMGMCEGHGVPEALCHVCTPALVAGFKVEGDWCDVHGLPRSQCALCAPGEGGAGVVIDAETPRSLRPAGVRCRTQDLRIQFASPAIAHRAGLEYATTVRTPVRETVECNAALAYDGARYARLVSRVPGVIREINVALGDVVRRGDTLALIDAPEVGAAKVDLAEAVELQRLWERNLALHQEAAKRGVAIQRDLIEAETQLAQSRVRLARARQTLANLGLSAEQIERAARDGDTDALWPLVAPLDGVVVERDAVVGEAVEPARLLFAVADTGRLWAMLDIYEQHAPKIKLGQQVLLTLDGLRGETFGGAITWIGAAMDPQTRTLKARAEIDNRDGRLRAHMFGKAVVTVRDQEAVVLVPKSAVQWDGCCNIVFVRRSDTLYEPRKLQLGYEARDFYVVEDGLLSNETVVTQGSFLLKTEIMKENIGAGCCEVEPWSGESGDAPASNLIRVDDHDLAEHDHGDHTEHGR